MVFLEVCLKMMRGGKIRICVSLTTCTYVSVMRGGAKLGHQEYLDVMKWGQTRAGVSFPDVPHIMRLVCESPGVLQ